MKDKGLGDTMARILKATTIDKIAKFALGDDCGCRERQDYLNKKIPYKKPNEKKP
tara:strand:+ start:24 stop:188 length:165 start_codon:yes stop_codon:yes gene_type:complete